MPFKIKGYNSFLNEASLYNLYQHVLLYKTNFGSVTMKVNRSVYKRNHVLTDLVFPWCRSSKTNPCTVSRENAFLNRATCVQEQG